MDEREVVINIPLYQEDDIAIQNVDNVTEFMSQYEQGRTYNFMIDREEMVSTAVGFSLNKRQDINIKMTVVKESFPSWHLVYAYLLNTNTVEVALA